jgi:energy-coupling factor transport system permease protein
VASLAPHVKPWAGWAGWAGYRLPRSLHPLAWWLWALGLTAAASRTTNPLLLGAIWGVVSWVVVARRSDTPWARAFRLYVLAGVAVVALRVFFRIVFGGGQGGHVLVALPEVALPRFAAGINLLGDVTAESLLSGFYDGLRLATMLVCLGAANALANPRRLLRSMPPALHEVSTAVVVALSVFPQLAESVVRTTMARRLRPANGENRFAAMLGVVIPVLEDALDRSLLLAASMDSRGYGRSGDRSRRSSLVVGVCLVVGLAGMAVGAYALLDATTPRFLATPVLLAGLAVGTAGVVLSGRGVSRSTYRPDRWRAAELVTVCSGLVAGILAFVSARADPTDLYPSVSPLTWPQVPVLPLVAILVGLVPAFAAPRAVSVESTPLVTLP